MVTKSDRNIMVNNNILLNIIKSVGWLISEWLWDALVHRCVAYKVLTSQLQLQRVSKRVAFVNQDGSRIS
jgi:hypothetical protein